MEKRNLYTLVLWGLIVAHLAFTIVTTAFGVRLPIPGMTVMLLLVL